MIRMSFHHFQKKGKLFSVDTDGTDCYLAEMTAKFAYFSDG